MSVVFRNHVAGTVLGRHGSGQLPRVPGHAGGHNLCYQYLNNGLTLSVVINSLSIKLNSDKKKEESKESSY